MKTRGATARVIACHDCGDIVSLSARACPGCGSRDLAGPVNLGRRAPRKVGIEQMNDRGLAAASITLGLLGACYGFAASSGMWSAIFATPLYGLLGVTVGVPIGFLINIIRN